MNRFACAVRNTRRALVATGAAMFMAPAAFAQTTEVEFDTAPVIAIVTEATTFIVTIGLAVLVMLMIAKGIKWARKAG